VQDTTVFTLHRKTEGLGPIGQAGLAGFFLHSCLAVSAQGVPLGILAHRLWVRPPEGKDSRKTRRSRPLDDKESARWIEVTEEAAQGIPSSTRVVTGKRHLVGHRQALRYSDPRRLGPPPQSNAGTHVEKAPVLGRTAVTVPRSGERSEREAVLTLRAATVTLRPPPHRKKEHHPQRPSRAGTIAAGRSRTDRVDVADYAARHYL